jgi:hypothetical protein
VCECHPCINRVSNVEQCIYCVSRVKSETHPQRTRNTSASSQLFANKGLARHKKSDRIRNMEINRTALAAMMERIGNELIVAAKGLRGKSVPVVAPQGAYEQAEKGICLACDGADQPPGKSLKRGQCVNCHAKTMRRIKAGTLRESLLIKAGKMLPAKPGGKRDADFPLDALADAAGIFAEQNQVQPKGVKRRKPARNNG